MSTFAVRVRGRGTLVPRVAIRGVAWLGPIMMITSLFSVLARVCRRSAGVAWVVSSFIGGCAPDVADGDTVVVQLEPGVPSDVIEIDVPSSARGFTVVVDGDPAGRFALASLVVGGVEAVDPADASNLSDPMIGTELGWQFPRRRTFAFQYPSLISQPLGVAHIRVISDRRGPARVRVAAATGPGRTLHVALVSFSALERLESEPPFVGEAREILARAGIELVVDEMVAAETMGELRIATADPTPEHPMYPLLERAHVLSESGALPVLILELADMFAGISGGVPCPPLVEHPYLAVVIDPRPLSDAAGVRGVGRFLAHELGHALGLPHPVALGFGVTDPFDDTPGATLGLPTGLMGYVRAELAITDADVTLTPQQVFAMTRSPLLE